jgi:O-antigen/teichoic acid export membrane protein
LKAIGEARFGVLSLVWLTFGYFGLFDFGLSRATANRLARLQADAKERTTIFYTSLTMSAGLGFLAATVFYIAARPLLTGVLAKTPELASEILPALLWIAALFPLAMMGNVFVGSLESAERFLTLNILQIVGSVLLQSLPLAAVLLFGARLEIAIVGAVTARILAILLLVTPALRALPPGVRPNLDWQHGKELLKFGGWITVTNGISPLLASIDQFMIASLLGARSLTHYSVPYSMALKVQILPGALARALFPRLSSLDRVAAGLLADRAVATLSGVMALVCAPAILLADFGLQIWISPDFAHEARSVARLILLGTWINGLAYVPLTLLQSQGRADLVAKFHAIELIPFIGLLWLCLTTFGLPGAALAWTIRVAIDAGLLFWATGSGWQTSQAMLPGGTLVLIAWLIATWAPPPVVAGTLALTLAALIVLWMSARDPILKSLLASRQPNRRLFHFWNLL